MTREEAKGLLPILKAFAEGKTVQHKVRTKSEVAPYEWVDVQSIDGYREASYYRIKPEPTYRPFNNAEECWNEMQKHQPFGWARKKNENLYVCITRVYGNDVFDDDFDNYTFADGEPFGVKEEEQ